MMVEKTSTLRVILRYARWITVYLLILWVISGPIFSTNLPSSTGDPGEKISYFVQHPRDYDLLFVGDSRTYTGMQPDLIDSRLGTRSLNLSAWSHWFPTQFPSFNKLAKKTPEGTTVVWSIGHVNFFPVHDTINNQYPIGIDNALRYLAWGFTWRQILPNLLHYNPSAGILGYGAGVRRKIEKFRLYPLYLTAGEKKIRSPRGLPPDLALMVQEYQADPVVDTIRVRKDQGEVTSLEINKKNGAYYRVEIDKNFFRKKQQENVERLRRASVPAVKKWLTPDPAYWNAFIAMLDSFERAGISLVVNEFEEAPQQYIFPEDKENWRSFMRNTVQPEVESRGYPYLRVDFDRFTPEDYFDYNHLNSEGVERFSVLFADLLRPHLQGR
jgi:hypothetical protein